MIERVHGRLAMLKDEHQRLIAAAQDSDQRIARGVNAFLELGLRRVRDDALCKAQRISIKIEALEEILGD